MIICNICKERRRVFEYFFKPNSLDLAEVVPICSKCLSKAEELGFVKVKKITLKR